MKRVMDYTRLFPNHVQDVIGSDVVDVVGSAVGWVQAVLLDDTTQQKIRFLDVATPDSRFVPVDLLASVEDGEISVNASTRLIQTAPTVAPDANLPE
ncbi:hypothetical protein E7T09_13515 [Deinococcus sp. KSM4-11]|uniref:PRC-barrel domain-containing protein n=1 Tax=Deinococcus sp. KSM4-11 TaxID=2568654 RepID=UPI0010A2AFE0|nr:PRC-barrel domain-containing protein [Deinococcus sp. KSM4-11]THF86224.1 hypothetical protein E7T09_13515 [Deinococcus sp. KSM4-11]